MNQEYFEVEIRNKAAAEAQAREARREQRKKQARRRAVIRWTVRILLLILLAVVLLRIAAKGTPTDAAENQPPTPAPPPVVTETGAIIDPDMGLVDPGAAKLPEDTPAEAEPLDPQEITDAIVEILLAQGYLSDAVPLPYEYQDYLRFFSLAYGVPYPLALATADYETGGTFDMDAVGPVGEVGIMQLYPGPEGKYHAELERATGMDPNTPMGNIAGGCYLLGKYMDDYNGDVTKVAMAYNMGVKGAMDAWAAGTTSTTYSNAILERVEKWGALVNAWRGF